MEVSGPITPAEVEAYRGAVGRQQTETQLLDRDSLRRFAAAIGEEPDATRGTVPPLWHWAYFLPTVARARIGPDGHPLRGNFLPAVRLPRRMWAAGELHFLTPLAVGTEATRQSRVSEVRHRPGKAGDLIFVEVDSVVSQGGQDCLRERQTIVYREAGGRVPAVVPIGAPAGDAWTPLPTDLFRFSAVTFNSHRIHYDQSYARDEEGYPDLVVHGPFTAVKLSLLAAQRGALRSFQFRAVAPLFVGQPVRLIDKGEAVEAVRCDGATAMTATVTR